MPKVSIIIPVYNVEPYLKRCLDSVIQQTLSDIEIICINDCSPDNCLAILREYAAKDPRVKVIDFMENKNAANARNAGLEVATGEYLGFVDPDDCIDLDFYEKLYNAAKSENADIVKGQRQDITLGGKIIMKDLNKIIKENNNKMAFHYEWSTAIYKAPLVYDNNINFPVECPKAQDIVFLTRCVVKAKKLILVDNTYYYYHRRAGSLDDKKISIGLIDATLYARKLICDELNQASPEEVDTNGYLYAYFHQLRGIIAHASFQNDSIECKRMCAQSLIENYYKCKDKETIEQKISETVFGYMLPYIKKFNIERISRELYECSSIDHLKQRNTEHLRRTRLLKNLRNHVTRS